jgi:hypothetical protein
MYYMNLNVVKKCIMSDSIYAAVGSFGDCQRKLEDLGFRVSTGGATSGVLGTNNYNKSNNMIK